MKATLTRQAIQVALAADDGGSGRPVLECVKIGNGEIVACDGFVFARCKIGTEPAEGEEILIDAKTVLSAGRITHHGDIRLEQHGTSVTFENEDASISIVSKVVEGKYPGTGDLLPPTERKAYVGLSKNILQRTLEIAAHSQDPLLMVKIREPSNPVVFMTGDITIYAMPMYRPEPEGG